MIVFFAFTVVVPPSSKLTSISCGDLNLPHPFTYSTCHDDHSVLVRLVLSLGTQSRVGRHGWADRQSVRQVQGRSCDGSADYEVEMRLVRSQQQPVELAPGH